MLSEKLLCEFITRMALLSQGLGAHIVLDPIFLVPSSPNLFDVQCNFARFQAFSLPLGTFSSEVGWIKLPSLNTSTKFLNLAACSLVCLLKCCCTYLEYYMEDGGPCM